MGEYSTKVNEISKIGRPAEQQQQHAVAIARQLSSGDEQVVRQAFRHNQAGDYGPMTSTCITQGTAAAVGKCITLCRPLVAGKLRQSTTTMDDSYLET